MKRIITLLLLLFTQSIFAKLILVSDIDDTIKVAHIRSKLDTVKNAFRTKNVFLGMSDLYRIVEEQTNAEIFYLTNAPQAIMEKSHRNLLAYGRFPQGDLLIRPTGVSSKVFKRLRLDQLMKEESPTQVILIGDNGEHDISFYNEIEKKYPDIKFHTYIRIAYDIDSSNKLKDGQIGFITPFEIAGSLALRDVLKSSDVKELLNLHKGDYLREFKLGTKGPMYTPKWQSCAGHKIETKKLIKELPLSIITKVNTRCFLKSLRVF